MFRLRSFIDSARNISTMAQCKLLTADNVKSFVNSFDNVLADCDGVLWNGMEAIPGSPETINQFIKMGKKVFFLTNNSTKTREEFLSKCHKLGFEATVDNIYSTAFAAASYLKNRGFNKKVFVVGSKGITQELDKVGIKHFGEGPDILPDDIVSYVKRGVTLDPEVGAVIVGFDDHFSYIKMLKAASYLLKPEVLFIGTNTDERFPSSEQSIVIPGTGCIVEAVRLAADRDPIVLGKPSPYIFDVMAKEYNLDPSRTIMIGDRMNTDILLGKNCNLQATLLVLTGVTYQSDVERLVTSPTKDDVIPDYYLPALGDLLPLL